MRDAVLLPKGHEQIASPAASTPLNVPAGASRALLNCTAVGIRLRGDAGVPTAALGILLEPNAKLWWVGDLSKVRVIQSAAGGILDVEYFA